MQDLAQKAVHRAAVVWLAGWIGSTPVIACADDLESGALGDYTGAAYALDDGQLLYREVHAAVTGGGPSSATVTYVCPDGKAFARKRLESGGNASAPDFEMTDGRSGYVEGARSQGDEHRVYVRFGKDAKERSAILKSSANLVIDAGFDAFVREHWNAIVGGKPTTIAFLVPSHLETLGFDIEHVGEETIEGRSTEHFRLELASWYGGLLPHIDVYYETATKRLSRYVGVSNVRDAGNRNVAVRIEFPRSADALAVATIDPGAPLDGRCVL